MRLSYELAVAALKQGRLQLRVNIPVPPGSDLPSQTRLVMACSGRGIWRPEVARSSYFLGKF